MVIELTKEEVEEIYNSKDRELTTKIIKEKYEQKYHIQSVKIFGGMADGISPMVNSYPYPTIKLTVTEKTEDELQGEAMLFFIKNLKVQKWNIWNKKHR